MSELSKLRDLALNATPGPWDFCATSANYFYVSGPTETGNHADAYYAERDAAYIAAADPTTILALLDENRDLRERVEQLVEYLHDIRTAKHREDAYDLVTEAIDFANRPIRETAA